MVLYAYKDLMICLTAIRLWSWFCYCCWFRIWRQNFWCHTYSTIGIHSNATCSNVGWAIWLSVLFVIKCVRVTLDIAWWLLLLNYFIWTTFVPINICLLVFILIISIMILSIPTSILTIFCIIGGAVYSIFWIIFLTKVIFATWICVWWSSITRFAIIAIISLVFYPLVIISRMNIFIFSILLAVLVRHLYKQ